MEIPKDKKDFKYIISPSIDNGLIEELDLDLSSKTNVFVAGFASKRKQIETPVVKVEEHKSTNPIRRLNAFDNEFLYAEELKKINRTSFKGNAPTSNKDLNMILKSIVRVAKRFFSNVPVIGYFMMKEKQAKLKSTLKSLNSINSEVDELINLSSPYGEQPDKYKILCENLVKANNIHAQIRKEIQD